MEQDHREGAVVVRIGSRPRESQRHEGASAIPIEMANAAVNATKEIARAIDFFSRTLT